MSLINDMQGRISDMDDKKSMGLNIGSVAFLVLLVYLVFKGKAFIAMFVCVAYVATVMLLVFGYDESAERVAKVVTDLKAKFMPSKEDKASKPGSPAQEDTIPPAPQC